MRGEALLAIDIDVIKQPPTLPPQATAGGQTQGRLSGHDATFDVAHFSVPSRFLAACAEDRNFSLQVLLPSPSPSPLPPPTDRTRIEAATSEESLHKITTYHSIFPYLHLRALSSILSHGASRSPSLPTNTHAACLNEHSPFLGLQFIAPRSREQTRKSRSDLDLDLDTNPSAHGFHFPLAFLQHPLTTSQATT